MLFKSALLQSIINRYRLPLLTTYGLLTVERLIGVYRPAALGNALNGLLDKEFVALGIFAGTYALQTIVMTVRKAYDTRCFTKIYVELSEQTVLSQRSKGIETSKTSARITRLREVVNFFEDDIPFLFFCVYNIIGSLAMLLYYNWLTVFVCLFLLISTGLVNYFYFRRMNVANARLNNVLEEQVNVLERAEPAAVNDYFGRMRNAQIKISDLNAFNFARLEVFVLTAIVVALVIVTQGETIRVGDILAINGYVQNLAFGFDFVPGIIEKLSLIKDIEKRINEEDN